MANDLMIRILFQHICTVLVLISQLQFVLALELIQILRDEAKNLIGLAGAIDLCQDFLEEGGDAIDLRVVDVEAFTNLLLLIF